MSNIHGTNNNSNQNQHYPRESGCCQQMCQYISNIPFCTKAMVVAFITLFFLVSFRVIQQYLGLTIFYFDEFIYEWWKLFTAEWYVASPINLIFGCLMFVWFIPNLERRIGSVRMFCRFLILGYLIQISVICIHRLIFQTVWQRIAFVPIRDFWFFCLIELYEFCFRNPEATIRYCMICPIKAKWIPFLALIFSLLSGKIVQRLIVLLLAYLSSKDRLQFLIIPKSSALCLERSVFVCFTSLSSFVKVQDSFNDQNFLSSVFTQIRNGNPRNEEARPQPFNRPQQQELNPFQGRSTTINQSVNQRAQQQQLPSQMIMPAQNIMQAVPVRGRVLTDQQQGDRRDRLQNSRIIQRYGQRAGAHNPNMQQRVQIPQNVNDTLNSEQQLIEIPESQIASDDKKKLNKNGYQRIN